MRGSLRVTSGVARPWRRYDPSVHPLGLRLAALVRAGWCDRAGSESEPEPEVDGHGGPEGKINRVDPKFAS
jgi:hypothetical protein